jgi:hypothetical protein
MGLNLVGMMHLGVGIDIQEVGMAPLVTSPSTSWY